MNTLLKLSNNSPVIRFRIIAPLCAIIGLIACGPMQATPIIYTFSGTASGSLGADLFTSAPFTITANADTSQIHTNIVSGNTKVQVLDSSASISIFGLNSATFTGSTLTSINLNGNEADFSTPSNFLSTQNAALHTYYLDTSLGPTSTTLFTFSHSAAATSGGNLALTAVSPTVIFQATLQSVPEPSALSLFGLGFAALQGCRCLKRNRPKRVSEK